MKKNKLKLIATTVILMSLLTFVNSTLASEVTGTLTTGISSNVVDTTVTGIVIVSPTANPIAGTYSSVQSVVLTANGSSNIKYTTDGSTPTCSTGTFYSGAISVNSTQTIKAISCYPENHSSNVSSFAYVINLVVNSNQVSYLINPSVLALPTGATSNSTPSLQTQQNIVINNSVSGGTSSVTLPINTTITTVSGQNFDASALTANTPAAGTLSGLTSGAVMDGSLQWGIVNLGLQFSNPITLSIYVGTSFNGQTLSIVRSTSGSDGWTSDGIVSPATCVVSSGLCTFSATKASYYATYHIAVTNTGGNSSSGGGSSNSSPVTTPILAVGNIKGNGVVNEYDFSILMADWGNTGSSPADLNKDGLVNEYDFSLLMANWGL